MKSNNVGPMASGNVGPLSVLGDLIKLWGIKKVIEQMIALLNKQGNNEQLLARDLQTALSAYERREDEKG